MSLNLSITFVAFSKFHLNTSNFPNTKVVQLFMGHNFHVVWHFKFEVENCEKAWSTPAVTVHRHRERFKICKQFMQNLWRKTSMSLCKSCRGFRDLQLCHSHLGALMLRNLEINTIKLEEYLGPLSGVFVI
jgi:hypothetical protein